jgi:crotonobetainyl-CoA:carnitine CoA-transferase CaiB-like acyl-CoA transferase
MASAGASGFEPSGPLVGIRVLEFTQIIAGPFGCQNLADMGAEVIKVEPPGGEPWRVYSQFTPGESKVFHSLNRGKRSLVLDLSQAEAQEVVHRLVPDIDIVVINYRPDVATKLGIDYARLAALRPDLIYIDNTAWGRKGPWAHRPGYDIIAQAVSGLMAADGKVDEGGAPGTITASPMADYGTGIAIAWAACAALYHRERTGAGQLIETSLLNTALAFQGMYGMDLPAADDLKYEKMAMVEDLRARGAPYAEILEAHGAGGVPRVGNVYYRAYATKDGAVAVGALSPSLRAKVRAAIPTEYLGLYDPAFDARNPEHVAAANIEVAKVEARFREFTTAEWLEILERHGVPCGPVNFVEEAMLDPQTLANEMTVMLDHEISGPETQVSPLLRMSATPLAAQGPSPVLGRHTDEVLRGAGYTEQEIAALRERGAIG